MVLREMVKRPVRLRGPVQGRVAYDAVRERAKISRRWYASKRWKDRRAMQLAMEPLCRFCMEAGRVTPATVADHMRPHREDADLFWHGALQSLCAACHSSAKQREERRGRRGGGG